MNDFFVFSWCFSITIETFFRKYEKWKETTGKELVILDGLCILLMVVSSVLKVSGL